MEEAINGADTAWLLVSSAFVMLMIPGLAFFYGGMVHSKNVLSSCMHSFFAMGLMTVQWVVIGYSLAFGETNGGIVGGMQYFMLNGVGLEPNGTIPHILFMAFQMMFAIITPALISGAFAERIKFSTYAVFIVLWGTLVYDPICHWVWGPGGWLGARGALDFAGGTVVHLSSGASALVFAIVLGKRLRPAPPGNLTLTLIGAALLWFGWFGFNAGSALASGENAALAFVNTHVAAAAAALAWAAVEWTRHGKPTSLGVASGLVAGLVCITPAAGFVGPMSAVLMGAVAGLICFWAVLAKSRFGYDDSLDAFGIHGVGGALGAVLTGVFAATAWSGNEDADGLLTAGNVGLVGEQVLGVLAAGGYAAFVTWVLLKILDATMGLRVQEDEEREGLDTVLHGETAYRPISERAGMHGEAPEEA
ncbi:MAG: ammonium transporter [Myxococcales bacterium]|nr:ammonium transporter [Myxococcales bacterium]